MKRCLIVVDYQVDFVSGTLGFPEAETLAAPIAQKIQQYHAAKDAVLFTLDTHGTDYASTQEGRNLPIAHCIHGTAGHALYGCVAQECLPQDVCFEKGTFGSDRLFAYLQQQAYTDVELVGLVSNICVLANAVLAKTALPEAHIAVDASYTASFQPALHEAALDVMEGLQIDVFNRKDGAL